MSARTPSRPIAAIILAAGKGTRMNSDLPKVAHEVAGRAMVCWVVEAARSIDAKPIVLVVGYGAQAITTLFDAADAEIAFATQQEQLGTGHATQCAAPMLDGFSGDVLVLAADGPLIRGETLRALIDRHRSTNAAATLATSTIHDPTGYGRIVRDAAGSFEAIVEHRNATPEQLAIHEVNPSYYCFRAEALFDALERVERNPVSGEFYLTDVPSILKESGDRVEVIDAVPPDDVLSINTPEQLEEVNRILTTRVEACA